PHGWSPIDAQDSGSRRRLGGAIDHLREPKVPGMDECRACEREPAWLLQFVTLRYCTRYSVHLPGRGPDRSALDRSFRDRTLFVGLGCREVIGEWNLGTGPKAFFHRRSWRGNCLCFEVAASLLQSSRDNNHHICELLS